ncbi:MAG: hypothetical protein IT562_13340 [Alphaproteobacteria bacterium]|nr:hypothetical protein [Alphaproteobacteria bacterium]
MVRKQSSGHIAKVHPDRGPKPAEGDEFRFVDVLTSFGRLIGLFLGAAYVIQLLVTL